VGILLLTAKLFYFFLPAGVANMAPVIFKNHLQWLAKPVDAGRKIAGEEIFGSHKTWRGLFVATLVGGFFFTLQKLLIHTFPQLTSWSPFDLRLAPWWFGFAFAAGAIVGDLVKSFFKRRFRVQPGATWFPFDQIDFLLGAALVASFVYELTAMMWVIIFFVGSTLHILVNHLAFWLKIKETPW
jgi:CDP-2,3-bis-(O-geranylgeranyl)-sn-glycerol synthase